MFSGFLSSSISSSSASSSSEKKEVTRPVRNLNFSLKVILLSALCNVILMSLSINAIGIFKSSAASIAPIISDPGFTSSSAPIFDWKWPRMVLTRNTPILFSLMILVIGMVSSSSMPAISFLSLMYLPLSSSIATTSGCFS